MKVISFLIGLVISIALLIHVIIPIFGVLISALITFFPYMVGIAFVVWFLSAIYAKKK